MTAWRSSEHQRAWRTYIETSLLLETRLDDDLRSATGLNMIDYHVLLLLSEAPGRRLRMGELADRLVFSPSRLTYQIKTMERRGVVLRQPSPDDKRVNHAVLTAAGLEAFRAAGPHHVATIQRLFTDDLGDDELRVLTTVFSRLRQRLITDGTTPQDSGPEPTASTA